jgi:ABC-2 type transport system permease protein
MNKLCRVAVYEYSRTVFKRSFILALLSVPLMICVTVGVGLFMESREVNNMPVGYVDHAGLLANPIPAPVSGSREPVVLLPFQSDTKARAALEAGEIQAYFVLSADYLQSRDASLYFLEEPAGNATRQFYDFLQINLLTDQPAELARRAALVSEGVTVRSLDGRREVPSGGPTFGLIMPLMVGFAFVFLLLMSAGYLMQAVVEEKENRTMEVLTTSVSPLGFISGKVLGIVAVSFTQLAIWSLVTVLAVAIARMAGIAWLQDTSLDWGIVLGTVALAVPSYVLAAAAMTAVGATVTSSKESQSIGSLFFILHLIPVYLSFAIVRTPNAALPTLLSFLPFTALMTVTLRNIFSAVPFWQIAASFVIQTLCAGGALWLASRAFRLGMLRYGQRLRWLELVKSRVQ